jgi:serine/threonine protein phosphatase 1
MLKQLFSSQMTKRPNLPNSRRPVYAIGDIHGRADLLEQLLDLIKRDILLLGSVPERPMIVFLGDYVDRGPASRSVVDLILRLRQDQNLEVRTLKGNHEQALLFFLADSQFGRTWISHGGATTLMSYSVRPPAPRAHAEEFEEARIAFQNALGHSHTEFFRELELYLLQDDYAFVHAGVRWGIPVHQQDERDLLWIRQEFLHSNQSIEQVVVHGHTPVEQPYLGTARIAIDTGAYATGILTAVRLWKSSQEILQAR